MREYRRGLHFSPGDSEPMIRSITESVATGFTYRAE